MVGQKAWVILIAAIPVLVIPLLGITWLNFSVFMFVYYFRERVQRWYVGLNAPIHLKLLISGMAFSYLTEILAIADNLPKPPSERILLSPDPFTDLYLALGYYLPFILLWSVLVVRYRYSARDVFLIGGIAGIFLEQAGAVFLSMNPFAWLYVFLVYGSFKAFAVLLAEGELGVMNRKAISRSKKAILGLISEFTATILAVLLMKALVYF
ncbi:hypothetical protein [Geoglobus acetivorans]|uniref:Uncharacterized protein n=1 Tax=Geoglobus acetivorans TaxID=565033 RepID=A0ABZ3H7B9_GEOAI|nr:hypothetical protein [Geoglobus acetivorans]